MAESQPRNIWTGIALALGIIAGMGIGAIVALLVVRRRKLETPGVALEGNPTAPLVLPEAPLLRRSPSSARPLTGVNTRRLPSLGAAGAQAIRIASANKQPIRVTLRPIGPPGSFAVFSQSAAELNTPGLTATNPTGYVFSIPVGDVQTVDLHQRQELYAKGNVDGVRLSITTALVPAES